MDRGNPTYMNAPIGLFGHIDEQGVRFKSDIEGVEVHKHQLVGKQKVFQTWRPLALCFVSHGRKFEGMDTARSVACGFT